MREPPKSRKANSMQRQQSTSPDEKKNQPVTSPEGPERHQLCIRAVQPADAEGLERLFFRLSPRTLYQRFLLPIPVASHQAYRVTNLGKVEHGTSYAAVACDEEEIRGIARYDREPAPKTVELSLLIEDAWQRRGLGKALASNMISEALRHGITQLTVNIQSENVPALRLVKALFPPGAVGLERRKLASQPLDRVCSVLPKRPPSLP